MNGLISAIVSAILLLISYIFGKVSTKKVDSAEAETVQAKSEAHTSEESAKVAKATADLSIKTAEAVVEAKNAETERVLTTAEIENKLASARQSGDQTIILELAGQMAQRAQERINRSK